MLPNIDYRELPRALQHLLARGRADEAATLPRRSFLKLAGAGGLALGAFPHPGDGTGRPVRARRPAPSSRQQQPSAFVQIAPNGEVTVTINRLEFGQGVQTGLPMILAEELDADWNLVRSRHGSNDAAYLDPLFGIHLTGGSHSIKNSFTQYRELGARARAMLLVGGSGALERRRGHPAHAGRHGAGPGWPQAGLRRTGRGCHGPARTREGHAEGSQGLPPHRPPHHAPGRARQEQRAPGLWHRRSPARSADGGGGPSAGVRRPPGVGGRQRGARHQGREGRAARAAGSRCRRRGRGGRWLLAGQAGPRRAEAAVGHRRRGEGGQRKATGPVPRTGRPPRPAQVRRRHGAAGHGAAATGSRVRLPLPGPCADGAAQLHRSAVRRTRRAVGRHPVPRSGRRRGRARAGPQARAGDGACADRGRRLWPAVRRARATSWSRPARSPRPHVPLA